MFIYSKPFDLWLSRSKCKRFKGDQRDYGLLLVLLYWRYKSDLFGIKLIPELQIRKLHQRVRVKVLTNYGTWSRKIWLKDWRLSRISTKCGYWIIWNHPNLGKSSIDSNFKKWRGANNGRWGLTDNVWTYDVNRSRNSLYFWNLRPRLGHVKALPKLCPFRIKAWGLNWAHEIIRSIGHLHRCNWGPFVYNWAYEEWVKQVSRWHWVEYLKEKDSPKVNGERHKRVLQRTERNTSFD